MLSVVQLEEARAMVAKRFAGVSAGVQSVPLDQALGRVLADDLDRKSVV